VASFFFLAGCLFCRSSWGVRVRSSLGVVFFFLLTLLFKVLFVCLVSGRGFFFFFLVGWRVVPVCSGGLVECRLQ